MTDTEINELLDRCYECNADGDDVFYTNDGDLASACEECWVWNVLREDDE